MWLSIPNIKFVCLNLWLGEVCIDNDVNDNANTDAKDNDRQSMIV